MARRRNVATPDALADTVAACRPLGSGPGSGSGPTPPVRPRTAGPDHHLPLLPSRPRHPLHHPFRNRYPSLWARRSSSPSDCPPSLSSWLVLPSSSLPPSPPSPWPARLSRRNPFDLDCWRVSHTAIRLVATRAPSPLRRFSDGRTYAVTRPSILHSPGQDLSARNLSTPHSCSITTLAASSIRPSAREKKRQEPPIPFRLSITQSLNRA